MNVEKISKKQGLNDRIKQIRSFLFDDNNRKFASEIGENEQTMSKICSNKRNAGLEIVQKILKQCVFLKSLDRFLPVKLISLSNYLVPY